MAPQRPEQPGLPFDDAPPEANAQPSAERPLNREAEGEAQRVFLGWSRPALEVAAEWIVRELGEDQSDVLIALPGGRAVRRLRELLAHAATPTWMPPRVVTQGELSDELVRLERTTAGRLTRTLAWRRALTELAPRERRRLSSETNLDDRSLLRLAETARTLHAELAREGLSFAALASGETRAHLDSEAARWGALAKAQLAYRKSLHEHDLEDPHQGRWDAIEAGRVDRSRRVILVGVADTDHLTARLLAHLDGRLTALIVAPEGEADTFDAFGRLRTELWKDRDVPLPTHRWEVCEKPVDQAIAAERVIASWSTAGEGGAMASDDLTIGVADEEVVPFLERRLLSAGARARHAAGTQLSRTRPFRALRAVSHYLQHEDYGELAALARDPDLVRDLGLEGDPAFHLDAYHARHLPKGSRSELVQDERRTPAAEAVRDAIVMRLGALEPGAERTIDAWAPILREFLQRVWKSELDPEIEAERVLSLALFEIGRGIAELEEVPTGLAGEPVDAARAIDLLLRSVRDRAIPPAAPRPGEAVVELLGWLELPLDDTPHLVVTGFNEGSVPASRVGDAFLPDGARRRLGLPADEERLARDVYAATVLLNARREVTFVSGRRSGVGDPLIPSRLAFHRPPAEVRQAVQRFLPPEEEARALPSQPEDDAPDYSCPRVEGYPPVERMRVSGFKRYLSSPYGFFLESVLGLETIDDHQRELSPLHFGNLAHEALEAFGKSKLRDSSDAEAIAKYLRRKSAALIDRDFGTDPLPAIVLQREQLAYRLGIFARRQARRRLDGWRIHAVEWQPPAEEAVLEVDGIPMPIGVRIDRIDVHEDGRWAVLDYKTSEKALDPNKTHRSGREWIDLQLPLYGHLARGLFDSDPILGYVNLGKDDGSIQFVHAKWKDELLAEAMEKAKDTVRRIRSGDFWDPGRKPPYGQVFEAIFGVGRVGHAGVGEVEA